MTSRATVWAGFKLEDAGVAELNRACDGLAIDLVIGDPLEDSPLLFPAHGGGHINLANWRTRDWYPALEAADVRKRGPYHLRHTFATEALAAGMPVFMLSRLMGCSVQMIERHYGHLAHDSEQAACALLDARAAS